MKELKNNSVDLVVTSPPYFNIKNYAYDGYQKTKHSSVLKKDVSYAKKFNKYIQKLLPVWKECYRVLKPNGKICINVPLIPILKKYDNRFHNRTIYDLQAEIQHSILTNTRFNLLDLYIWNRINSTKRLMFGSYPYPSNFYAQNTTEFISVYVKPGKAKKVSKTIKEKSKITQSDWLRFTSQIWNIPIPNRNDKAFGKHCAIMPIEIANRCIKLYSFIGDTILDPFAGSGTTLVSAKNNNRNFIGYEIYKNYKPVINKKVYEK